MRAPFFTFTGALLVTALLLAGSLINPPKPPESTCKIHKFLCSEPRRQKVFVQFVLQPNTPETARITEDLLYLVSKRVRPKHFVEISRLSGAGNVEVLYSATATKQAMQAMHWQVDSNPDTIELDPTPSSEAALINGIQRLRDRIKALPKGQELHFYLVTEGTTNPAIISRIQEITASLADEDLSLTHIYLIGLSEQNRLKFSIAFNPIADRMNFSSSNSGHEWLQLVREF